jgi:ATP-binding cassette, subfamily B, bacterial
LEDWNLRSLRFVMRYMRKYRGMLFLTVISMLLLVGVQLLAPWLVKTMISTVTDAQAIQTGLSRVTQLALFALSAYAARAILQFARSYLAHVAGWNVVADVRADLFQHLQRLSLRFYENRQTGQLMSQLVNDADLLEHMIAHAIPDIIANSLLLIGVIAILLNINTPLTLLSMIPIPLIILVMKGFNTYVQPAFRARQIKLGDLNAVLNDSLSGVREIKAFTREEAESARVGDHIIQYRNSMLRALRLMATFRPIVEFASSLGTIVLIYFGGRFILGQTLVIEDLVAFFLYLELLYEPVRALSGVWENLQQALAGAGRVSELLQEAPSIVEKSDALELPSKIKGQIEITNVQFHYERGENVLEDINLHIAPGTVTALVGPTGVGKTTLANLIPRFYDVCDGSISVDGYDIRDIKLKSIRQQISMVLQDVFLFHGTVSENILFGRVGATKEEMVRAARIANAEEFIQRLPEGYETMIGERGVKLSGGQRQRIAIARAVLKDAPILILDEATSAVDTETEMLIQQALQQLMIGKTVIVIAHRLSTIRSADLIVVLEGNRIVEQGTHAKLILKNGLYKRLTNIQVDGKLARGI